jgi:hypothetical protein
MIEWSKPERYYVASRCDRYTVSKAIVGDRVLYTAWFRADGSAIPIGSPCGSPVEAKERCQQHKESGK